MLFRSVTCSMAELALELFVKRSCHSSPNWQPDTPGEVQADTGADENTAIYTEPPPGEHGRLENLEKLAIYTELLSGPILPEFGEFLALPQAAVAVHNGTTARFLFLTLSETPANVLTATAQTHQQSSRRELRLYAHCRKHTKLCQHPPPTVDL